LVVSLDEGEELLNTGQGKEVVLRSQLPEIENQGRQPAASPRALPLALEKGVPSLIYADPLMLENTGNR
jgi:hypothetical protein